MEAVLRPPIFPVPTSRPVRPVVALCLLVIGLGYVGQGDLSRSASVPMSEAGPVVRGGMAVMVAEEAGIFGGLALAGGRVALAEMRAPVQQPSPLLDQAVGFIEPFEGRRHRAYRDSRGYLTIGVGFNLDRAGAAADINRLLPGVSYRALRRRDMTLTDAQIDVLLRHDAQRAIDTARRQVDGFDALPNDAQMIVIDMTFNTGSLHKWRRLRAALAQQDYGSAAEAMHRSRWRRQTGQRAEHLIALMRSLSNG